MTISNMNMGNVIVTPPCVGIPKSDGRYVAGTTMRIGLSREGSFGVGIGRRGEIMSNRHMATKRSHNKITPKVKRKSTKKAAARQLPPVPVEEIQAAHVGVVHAPPLCFESPESSNIHSAEYDPDTRQLFVTFNRTPPIQVKTGAITLELHPTYRYGDISLELWIEFYQASSKGKFVAQRLKPFYAGTRV